MAVLRGGHSSPTFLAVARVRLLAALVSRRGGCGVEGLLTMEGGVDQCSYKGGGGVSQDGEGHVGGEDVLCAETGMRHWGHGWWKRGLTWTGGTVWSGQPLCSM